MKPKVLYGNHLCLVCDLLKVYSHSLKVNPQDNYLLYSDMSSHRHYKDFVLRHLLNNSNNSCYYQKSIVSLNSLVLSKN